MTDTKRVMIGAEINSDTRNALLEIAAVRGEGWTFSAVVRTALDAYVKTWKRNRKPTEKKRASA